MTVYINDEPHEVIAPVVLQEILDQKGFDGKGTAVAINDTVVSRKDWQSTNLSEDDKILIISAACGG